MPRAGWVKPRPDERLTDNLSIGVLTREFPADAVDAAVDSLGRREERSRLLPARVVVYFNLGLALFRSESYVDVMRQLVAGVEWSSGWETSWDVPSAAALSLARERLGEGVMEAVFDAAAGPVGGGPRVAGLVPVAVDGTVLDVADTPANAAFFGRPGSKEGTKSAYPQVRVLALAECGSQAVFAAVNGPCRTGEQTMLPGLLGALRPGTLMLADRGFFSFDLWEAARATGAGLCWRMKKNSVLPVLDELPDGSYLSRVYPSREARAADAGGADVRVVEYTVGEGGEGYRLITTLLDPEAASAADLAAAYRGRWRIESAFDELKTHQGGPALVLRSKSPKLVRQEVASFLCVHLAIRKVMADTAASSGRDPTEASFTTALRSARRTVVTNPGFSPLLP
ncbi:MAG: IS4 family transposase [Bifidobacteriaceae bacterium]|nr:IS4 family transposase [Bifidobacteriaceae bacterium]